VPASHLASNGPSCPRWCEGLVVTSSAFFARHVDTSVPPTFQLGQLTKLDRDEGRVVRVSGHPGFGWAAVLPGGERGRERAGDVQGPGDHAPRPAQAAGGVPDCGRRHARPRRLHLHPVGWLSLLFTLLDLYLDILFELFMSEAQHTLSAEYQFRITHHLRRVRGVTVSGCSLFCLYSCAPGASM
jgi:hypothetical protein